MASAFRSDASCPGPSGRQQISPSPQNFTLKAVRAKGFQQSVKSFCRRTLATIPLDFGWIGIHCLLFFFWLYDVILIICYVYIILTYFVKFSWGLVYSLWLYSSLFLSLLSAHLVQPLWLTCDERSFASWSNWYNSNWISFIRSAIAASYPQVQGLKTGEGIFVIMLIIIPKMQKKLNNEDHQDVKLKLYDLKILKYDTI